ncbi:MAG: C25 family cysteine peptidase [Candidatus Eisenbacteria bacterium]
MRNLFVTTVCLGLLSAAALLCAGEPAAFSVSRAPGTARVTMTLLTDGAPEEPVLRFLTLPPGASGARIAPADEAAASGVSIGKPMIARGTVLLPVLVRGAAGGPAKSGSTVAFDILYEEGPEKKNGPVPARFGRGYLSSLGKLLIDKETALGASEEEGGYLIVSAPELLAAVEPLARWKREMGFDVTVVSTSVAGAGNEGIRTYVRNLYLNSEPPPQYLVLVGDVDLVPGWDYHQSVTDLPYALIDGDDFLPDLYVGRLSAGTVEQANTIVSKIVGYESDPYRADTTWFSRALLVAGDYSSSTPVPVSRWCREMLYGTGFAAVDTVFYPPHWSTAPPFIRASIDRGVSLVSYRGWAYSWRGWEPPKFTVDHIPSLNNGRKLPAVFSFVCENGNYAEYECFGEAWIRAGTPETPKGAVAFIGNSEHWSHTRHNDAAAIGAFDAIGGEGIRRLGDILHASKYEIYREFPDLVYYQDHEDESVEFYFYIYSLLGDPSMELHLGVPREIAIARPDTIAKGSNYYFVTVTEAGGGDPIEGARVGLSQAGDRLASAFTDGSGEAKLIADFSDDSAPVAITVTGGGLQPLRDSVPVVSNRTHLGLAGVSVRDNGAGRSQGNGDGAANPGETLEIRATLRNANAVAASGVTGFLVGLSQGYTIDPALVGFPDIAAGATAASETTWVVRVGKEVEDRRVLRFLLQAYTGGIETDNAFDLAVRSHDFRYDSHALGGDGVLDPGDTLTLHVTVRNEGSAGAPATTLLLRSETPDLAAVLDSASSLAVLGTGQAGTTAVPFRVHATDSAAVGQGAVFTLLATTASGIVRTTSFTIAVGTASHRAPLGPDAYGYYAYDNSDTDYPDGAPLYEWISCSPAYGGAGTGLDLEDNDFAIDSIPFPFTFYGKSYNWILISDNGWAAFDTIAAYDFYNWSLPNRYGSAAMIAPFWDNLDPEKAYGGARVGDGVYVFPDTANHRYVIEWSRLGNLRPHHGNRLDYDELQTFELILYDPVHYPTPTGDGVIRFQYKQVVNNDFDRMYASVGIEDASEEIGLEYSYTNLYPAAASPLSAGLAIEFSTKPPRHEPFRLAAFRAEPGEEGVRLVWEPCDDRPRGATVVYREGADGSRAAAAGWMLPASSREFLDTETDPDSSAAYWIGSLDPVGNETLLGPFPYAGRAGGPAFALVSLGPNPSRGSSVLRYMLPSKERVKLRIYTISGRIVRTVIDGEADPGGGTVVWDGRDDAGREAPSGVYFARFETERERRAVKLLLLR